MNASLLVLSWAAVALTALLAGPRLPLSLQAWVATSLAIVAALICFVRLVYK